MPPESAAQSSTYGEDLAERAIDGSLTTASHTECAKRTPIWFKLNFRSKHCFKKFRIYQSHRDPSEMNSTRKRMDGVRLVVTDKSKQNPELLCEKLNLGEKLQDSYVDLECFPALYGDLVELSLEKNRSLACIHMFEIESYAVELECPEGSVMAVSDGTCSCVTAGKINIFLIEKS